MRMATKKEHRLSIRWELETLIWLGKVAQAAHRDSSFVVRSIVEQARVGGRLPPEVVRAMTVVAQASPDVARKAGL